MPPGSKKVWQLAENGVDVVSAWAGTGQGRECAAVTYGERMTEQLRLEFQIHLVLKTWMDFKVEIEALHESPVRFAWLNRTRFAAR